MLSHNDDDHFKGIPVLIENGKVSEVTPVLLLRYVVILSIWLVWEELI